MSQQASAKPWPKRSSLAAHGETADTYMTTSTYLRTQRWMSLHMRLHVKQVAIYLGEQVAIYLGETVAYRTNLAALTHLSVKPLDKRLRPGTTCLQRSHKSAT